METISPVYNDFPAEKFRADQVVSRTIIDWHRSHSLVEANKLVDKGCGLSTQRPPEGFHFVLHTPHGYFPHHLEPHKPTATSLRLARRFDNILLALAHGDFWATYLPEDFAKSIVVRVVPA